MTRTIMMCVCGLALGLQSGCDRGAEEAKKAEAAHKAAMDSLAGKDREIAALKAELAKQSEKPAVAAPATPTPAVPTLDAEIVRAAATAAGVTKLKLEAENDGSLRELSLYHNDAAALPAAVTAMLDAQYPGAKIRAYETEFNSAHGRLFEVEVLTADKRECEYSATPDGRLIYNECHIDPKTLPEPIQALVSATVPKAKILEAEKTTYPDGREAYSVELSADGKVHELYFERGVLIRHELVITAQLEVPV